MGCHQNTNPLLVPDFLEVRLTNTPLDCARACKEADPAYTSAGLIHYYHCYCGSNAIPTEGAVIQAVCAYQCIADPTQICGYGAGNAIYTIESDSGKHIVVPSSLPICMTGT